MDWIIKLFTDHQSIAYTVIVYAFVIGMGVALGKVKIFGISFGIACVLFTGILVSHLGFTLNPEIQHFVKEFGLILFVYTIGLQVGPGFFASLQKAGFKLNLLAIISVVICVATVIAIHYATGIQMPDLVGIMSGAVTNTPGLGAAQATAVDISGGVVSKDVLSVGYAVAYPFGVLGIIIVMLVFRAGFRVNLEAEKRLNSWKHNKMASSVDKLAVLIENPNFFNKDVTAIRKVLDTKFVISRLYRGGEVLLVDKNTILKERDILLIVANPKDFERIITVIGSKNDLSLFHKTNMNIVSRRMNVTNKMAYAKKLGEFNVTNRFGVTISRIYRAGVEFVPDEDTKLQFGDTITVVGDEASIKMIEKVFGNSKKRLQTPHIAELFFGIMLGVFVGAIPFHIPGVPMPVKLGLAGGPLIVAILISRFGGRFSVTHYVSQSANLMVREIGIVLFLASVGLGAGEKFVQTITQGAGLYWMLLGAIITLVPLIVISVIARFIYKLNFLEICGLLSGTQTDPPALAFSHDITGSDSPSITYASVYPLTTFLRIMVAQLLIVLFY